MRYMVMLLTLSVMLVPCSDAQDGTRDVRRKRAALQRDDTTRWAVVIGINQYLDPGIPALEYCVADAKLIAKNLQENCGYAADHILVLSDEEAKAHLRPLSFNLRTQMKAWFARAGQNDTLFVFFSGHGFVDDAGQGYLAVQDCELPRLEQTGFRTSELRELLASCSAKQKLLVLDCCHAGSAKGKETPPSSQEVGQVFEQSKGLITIASCQRDERSQEWRKLGHGLFTWHFSQGLGGAADADNDGIVDSDEIYLHTFRAVSTAAQREFNARQNPVRMIPPDVTGKFPLAWVASTQGGLQEVINDLALETADVLKGTAKPAVAVAEFQGSAEDIATAGPGLNLLFRDALAAQGIALNTEANVILQGNYSRVQREKGRSVVRIRCELRTRDSKLLATLIGFTKGVSTYAMLMGVNASLPTDQPERVRQNILDACMEAPTADIQASRLAAAPKSPYAIEILTGPNRDQPRALRDVEGNPFVALEPNELYGIKIYNDSDMDAAVVLSIDGLNLFTFSTLPYRYMIVRAKSSAVIKGWHRNNETSDGFQITEYSQSPAALLLKSKEKVGMITAQFSAAWPEDVAPPADEFAAGLSDRGPDIATGRGAQVEQRYTEVKRIVGAPRAFLCVRYAK